MMSAQTPSVPPGRQPNPHPLLPKAEKPILIDTDMPISLHGGRPDSS